MLTLLLIALVLVIVGCGAVMFVISRAPEGYEDETGFHPISAPRGGLSIVSGRIDSDATLPAGRQFAA